jgi:hypothetical protein
MGVFEDMKENADKETKKFADKQKAKAEAKKAGNDEQS